MIEVELKYPVPSLESIRGEFLNLGAIKGQTIVQSDEYLNDPLRDFAKLDLALRIRHSDDEVVLTFKGPNLDETAKIRQETEIPLADQNAADQIKQVFLGIGFRSLEKVVKRREQLDLNWQDRDINICLDEVNELGGFVELELVVDIESAVPEAKSTLLNLAELVGLTGPIRTSYLAMLLENREEL